MVAVWVNSLACGCKHPASSRLAGRAAGLTGSHAGGCLAGIDPNPPPRVRHDFYHLKIFALF